MPGYTLEALLGRGGSGEVWRAVPRAGGPAVAVKLLVAGDAERQAREAALLGALDHPHLVRLHEVVHQPRRGGPPRVALVLDLLPGGSLAALIARRGRLRAGEVVTAVAPVAAAVAHAHEQGIVHGDLAPGNVVFTADGRPVLTDLGVARLLGEEAAGQVTPAYVDPTVARGGAVGPASDVFGLAAAAFHALTGVAPWNGATPADVLEVASAGLLPDLDALAPDAPPALRAVIARGLAADPHDRGTAAALALDLRHACRPEPVRLASPDLAGSDLPCTGDPPAVELTHQVPGRHPRPAPEVVVPGRRLPWRIDRARRGRHGSEERVRRPRRLVAVVLLPALVAVTGWLVVRGATPDAAAGQPAIAAPVESRRPAETPPAPPAPPRPSTPERSESSEEQPSLDTWRSTVAALYADRARAFAGSSARALDAVYTADSPLRAADAAVIEDLRSSGAVVRGFEPEVIEVRAATLRGSRAELRLVDRWARYVVVEDGAAREVPGRGDAVVDLVVVRTDGGWRIDSARLLR